MQQKITAFIKQHKMIEEQDHVIVGCSGGADSVCLLLVLSELSRRMGFSLSTVHVEHGIRGEESRQDAAFTETLCKNLGIPLVTCPVDAPAYAASHRMGLEEAARELRYAAFGQAARAMRYAESRQAAANIKIALAHHMEDNAETMLFQLARGSGLAGLCGIPAVRAEGQFCYIRPLLCVTRGEIERYLKLQDQPYCTDRTNLDEAYTRNRIRRQLIPQMTAVNAQAVQHMNRSAEKISEAYEFIRENAEKIYSELVAVEGGSYALCAPKLLLQHPAILHEVLRMVLFEAAGHRRDIAEVHVKELEHLMRLQSGRRVSLPYGLCAFMEYDMLYVCRSACADGKLPGVEEFFVTAEALCAGAGIGDPVYLGGRAGTDEDGSLQECAHAAAEPGLLPTCREDAPWFLLWDGGACGRLRAKVWQTQSPLEEITKKTCTKQFNYDKIKSGFFVRKRQKGDYFELDREGHKKKLSDYMVDAKIPARLRDGIPLLAKGSEVIWLIGGRISAGCQVTEDTVRIMEMEYYGGMSDGR